MAIERLLGEEIGPLAGKLHTGRSRNDQVATDVAMVVQAHSLRAIELCGAAMQRLLGLAEAHTDWTMPGYTHLQRAQPVYLGHHLLAYFWMLARDVLRFQFALDSASVMPLGSGALAGVNWEIDRDVGRRRPRLRPRQPQLDRRLLQPRLRPRLPERRLDLRDAPLAPRLGNRHLVEQRVRLLRARRVLLLGLLDHAAEEEPRLGRAAAGEEPARRRLATQTLLGVMHALPLTYGKDMQEDKEPLFDAIDTVEACLDATAGMLDGIEFRPRADGGGLRRRDAGGDRGRRPAGPPRRPLPRGARDRRRPRPRRGRARQDRSPS